MLRALNNFPVDRSARYNRFPPRRHVQKLFISEIEFRFTFLCLKNQKVDLKVPFSNSKYSIIFNDLLAGASKHKSERFFFNFFFVFKFLSLNFLSLNFCLLIFVFKFFVFKFLKYFEIFNIF